MCLMIGLWFKIKISKKTHNSMVVLFAQWVYLGRFLLWCFVPMMMQTKWKYYVLTQGIRPIKTFNEYKKYYWWSVHHKKHKKRVDCWYHCDKLKTNKLNWTPNNIKIKNIYWIAWASFWIWFTSIQLFYVWKRKQWGYKWKRFYVINWCKISI